MPSTQGVLNFPKCRPRSSRQKKSTLSDVIPPPSPGTPTRTSNRLSAKEARNKVASNILVCTLNDSVFEDSPPKNARKSSQKRKQESKCCCIALIFQLLLFKFYLVRSQMYNKFEESVIMFSSKTHSDSNFLMSYYQFVISIIIFNLFNLYPNGFGNSKLLY